MPLNVTPFNKLTYKLRLTSQMKLDITLLQMPLVKLKGLVKQQLEENPVLEIETLELSAKTAASPEEYSIQEDNQTRDKDSNYNRDDGNEQDSIADRIAKPTTLAEHLLRQLRLLTGSTLHLKIGECIIGNIDDDGYLLCPLEDIAGSAQTSPAKVQKILILIQTFDPVGVGARDLRECLLLQLQAKARESSLAYCIVDQYLSDLENKKFYAMAKQLKVSVNKIREAMKEIASLEPNPGRSFNTETAMRLIPDVLLRKTPQGYDVMFNNFELPRLTLNEKYKKMLQQKNTPEDAREYLRERVVAARSLIYAVKKRKQTIQEVVEAIVAMQNDFLDKGITHLRPMTLDQIAQSSGKSKSTISRTLSNKYIQTPWGILELRYFLNAGVKQTDETLLSSKAIKSIIADLIHKEKKKKPLSDQKIMELLKRDGIIVARRTIAKYRKQIKILSSQSRKE